MSSEQALYCTAEITDLERTVDELKCQCVELTDKAVHRRHL